MGFYQIVSNLVVEDLKVVVL